MQSLSSSSDPALSLSSPWHSAPLPAADTQKHPIVAAAKQTSRWRISWGWLYSTTPNHNPLSPYPYSLFYRLEIARVSLYVWPQHEQRGNLTQDNIWSSIWCSYAHTQATVYVKSTLLQTHISSFPCILDVPVKTVCVCEWVRVICCFGTK